MPGQTTGKTLSIRYPWRVWNIWKERADAKGRKITVHKLPIPDHPVCVTGEELEGYVFEDGEDVREEGERLAASYVNFYFSNGAVVLPAFGGENERKRPESSTDSGKTLSDREIIPVYARDILTGEEISTVLRSRFRQEKDETNRIGEKSW